jgi:hypothetical protein
MLRRWDFARVDGETCCLSNHWESWLLRRVWHTRQSRSHIFGFCKIGNLPSFSTWFPGFNTTSSDSCSWFATNESYLLNLATPTETSGAWLK